MESLFFIKAAGLRSHAQGFLREFHKIFKNSFFIEHLSMTTSILQQLLTLYFATIHSWQLASSEISLVGKKFIYISQGFTDLIYTDSFFHFLWEMRVYLKCRLHKIYAVLWAVNRFIGSETPKHNAFGLVGRKFET